MLGLKSPALTSPKKRIAALIRHGPPVVPHKQASSRSYMGIRAQLSPDWRCLVEATGPNSQKRIRLRPEWRRYHARGPKQGRLEPSSNRVGGGVAAPVLSHHRTYSVVSGGFSQACNITYR